MVCIIESVQELEQRSAKFAKHSRRTSSKHEKDIQPQRAQYGKPRGHASGHNAFISCQDVRRGRRRLSGKQTRIFRPIAGEYDYAFNNIQGSPRRSAAEWRGEEVEVRLIGGIRGKIDVTTSAVIAEAERELHKDTFPALF